MMRRSIAVALMLCVGGYLANAGERRAIDGDTLVTASQHIRLYGIDALELNQPCFLRGFMGDPGVRVQVTTECGQDARRALAKLIDGTDLTCRATGHDRYGRIVAICHTPDTPDIGEAMVRQGMAVRYPKYDPQCLYCAAEAEAKREKRGVWAGEFQMPWEWRRDHKINGMRSSSR